MNKRLWCTSFQLSWCKEWNWCHWWCHLHHMTLTPVPMAAHDEVVPHFSHIDLRNAMMAFLITFSWHHVMPTLLLIASKEQKCNFIPHFDHPDLTNAVVSLTVPNAYYNQKSHFAHHFSYLAKGNVMMAVAVYNADTGASGIDMTQKLHVVSPFNHLKQMQRYHW